MSKIWIVDFTKTTKGFVRVKAESKEEAREKAYDSKEWLDEFVNYFEYELGNASVEECVATNKKAGRW